MTHEVITYRTDMGSVVAIIGPAARIYTQMVFIDSPIRKYSVPNGDVELYRRPIPEKMKPTVKKAARGMIRAGKYLGITKGAKTFLRECYHDK